MQVFISWSGETSKAVAEALGAWLQLVIQAVDPWISTDMTKGTRWNEQIAARVADSPVSIFVLTLDNRLSEWLHFEAGIARAKDAHVCTFLFRVESTDVRPPLSQFQHTVATAEADVRKLVGTINQKVGETGARAVPEAVLDKTFKNYWPDLKSQFDDIAQLPLLAEPQRPTRELLEEILSLVRAFAQDLRGDQLLNAQINIIRQLIFERERTRSGLKEVGTEPPRSPSS